MLLTWLYVPFPPDVGPGFYVRIGFMTKYRFPANAWLTANLLNIASPNLTKALAAIRLLD